MPKLNESTIAAALWEERRRVSDSFGFEPDAKNPGDLVEKTLTALDQHPLNMHTDSKNDEVFRGAALAIISNMRDWSVYTRNQGKSNMRCTLQPKRSKRTRRG